MPSTCSTARETSIDAPNVDISPAWQRAAVTLDVEVRFAETDLMGVVHHSAYVVWFEAGRVAWMETVGMPYTEIAATGHHFAVTSLEAEYRAAAHFGDKVCVTTYMEEARSRRVRFRYLVSNSRTSTLLATGRSGHICVDLEGRMATIPALVIQRLTRGGDALANDANGN